MESGNYEMETYTRWNDGIFLRNTITTRMQKPPQQHRTIIIHILHKFNIKLLGHHTRTNKLRDPTNRNHTITQPKI